MLAGCGYNRDVYGDVGMENVYGDVWVMVRREGQVIITQLMNSGSAVALSSPTQFYQIEQIQQSNQEPFDGN